MVMDYKVCCGFLLMVIFVYSWSMADTLGEAEIRPPFIQYETNPQVLSLTGVYSLRKAHRKRRSFSLHMKDDGGLRAINTGTTEKKKQSVTDLVKKLAKAKADKNTTA